MLRSAGSQSKYHDELREFLVCAYILVAYPTQTTHSVVPKAWSFILAFV